MQKTSLPTLQTVILDQKTVSVRREKNFPRVATNVTKLLQTPGFR